MYPEKGNPVPAPGRTLELTVFWLFDGAIKAFDYDVLVFLGELLLQRGGGVLPLFYVAGSPHFPSTLPKLSMHTLFCTFAHLVMLLMLLLCSQSGACLVFHYLQPPPRCTSAFSAFRCSRSFHTNFRKYSCYLGILPHLRCNLCEFYFFRHVVSPCRVPCGGAR